MKTPLQIMARSGMGNQQKIQILANELTRRLANINVLRTTVDNKQKLLRNLRENLKTLNISREQ